MKELQSVFVLLSGLSSGSAQVVPELSEYLQPEPDWTARSTSSGPPDRVNTREEDLQNPATPQNSLDSQNLEIQPDSGPNSFDLSYEPSSQSSFDPYGFKLSPEHSSHTLLDPDEAQLSPDHEPSSSQPHDLNFDPFGFDVTTSQVVHDSDPYGFKLSPEEENQEVLDDLGPLGLCRIESNERPDLSDYNNQEVLKPSPDENREVLEGFLEQLETSGGNQEVLEPSRTEAREQISHENQELLDFCLYDNKETPEPCSYDNQETLEPCSYDNQEVLEPCSHDLQDSENQEVVDLDCHGNQEHLDFCHNEVHRKLVPESHQAQEQELQNLGSKENQELVDLASHDNQKVLDLPRKEANNNPEPDLSSTNSSSDSDVPPEDLQRPEIANSSNITQNPRHLLEGDLGSVFGAGGYIGCPDVADDLEPLQRRQGTPVAEPARPVRPVRPPRPSLMVS